MLRSLGFGFSEHLELLAVSHLERMTAPNFVEASNGSRDTDDEVALHFVHVAFLMVAERFACQQDTRILDHFRSFDRFELM